jgi:hypothetical protein
MILVDSNVWRQTENPGGNPVVQRWLSDNETQLALSAVVLAEMYFGVALMPDGKRKTDIAMWIDRLAQSFEDAIVPFDEKCAHAFGQLAADTKKSGRTVSTIDMQLAAQAQAHRMTIATRNVKDFSYTEVALINPWDTP